MYYTIVQMFFVFNLYKDLVRWALSLFLWLRKLRLPLCVCVLCMCVLLMSHVDDI